MNVVLIGAGRYGNNLIGSKYSRGDYYNAKLDCVVDPKIKEICQKDEFNLHGADLYENVYEIPQEKINDKTVAELAIVPTLIPQVLARTLSQGIKKIILPKPVAQDWAHFKLIKGFINKNNAQAYVASNWHYSDITKLLKGLIAKARGQEIEPEIKEKFQNEIGTIQDKFEIEKVEIEYSKKHEVLTIDPPSQELPHALQIVQSSGLMNLEDAAIKMCNINQSKSAVNVSLYSKDVKKGIHINSDLQKGIHTDKRRERIVKIYLNDDDKEADIIADYDAFFENGVCKKPASISVDILKGNVLTKWKKEIHEDNMDKMYQSMFEAFEGKENDALTLEKYEPIAKVIGQVQKIWSYMKKDKVYKFSGNNACL